MPYSVESVLVHHPVFGFFGKIPAVGDFVQRNLAASVSASVDAWLQEGMYLLGQQGQPFQDSYLISEVGFFVLPQQVWAEQAIAGFIMPSIDRVGRLFPLVFLQSLADHQPIDLGPISSELGRASDMAIHALQQRMSPDELYQRLLVATAGSGAAEREPAPDTEAGKAFAMDGTHSLWWRRGATGAGSVNTFDATDVHGIFTYLYR